MNRKPVVNAGFCFCEAVALTGSRINQRRVQDVLQVKAQTVASACAFCMTMLDDGAKALSVDEKLSRKDIAERWRRVCRETLGELAHFLYTDVAAAMSGAPIPIDLEWTAG